MGTRGYEINLIIDMVAVDAFFYTSLTLQSQNYYIQNKTQQFCFTPLFYTPFSLRKTKVRTMFTQAHSTRARESRSILFTTGTLLRGKLFCYFITGHGSAELSLREYAALFFHVRTLPCLHMNNYNTMTPGNGLSQARIAVVLHGVWQ